MREIKLGADFERYSAIRRALQIEQTITPELTDSRIEDGFADRKSVRAGEDPIFSGRSPVNLNEVASALGLRDTRDVSLLKNAVRKFMGWPVLGRLDRVHVDENGAELAWVKALRDRLRLPDSANVQTVLRTALAALPGNPFMEILGSAMSVLHGTVQGLEQIEGELSAHPWKDGDRAASLRSKVAQVKRQIRESQKALGEIDQAGVPRVWRAEEAS